MNFYRIQFVCSTIEPVIIGCVTYTNHTTCWPMLQISTVLCICQYESDQREGGFKWITTGKNNSNNLYHYWYLPVFVALTSFPIFATKLNDLSIKYSEVNSLSEVQVTYEFFHVLKLLPLSRIVLYPSLY